MDIMKKLNPLQSILDANIRTGTKVSIINWIVIILLVICLNIIFPILSIKFPQITGAMTHLNISATTIALLGNGALVTITNEIRKAVENKIALVTKPTSDT